MNLSNLHPPKGAKHAKKRVGRGQGSGNGKTGRARPQGREVAFGLQAQARIRRRPDAAAPPRAEARVPQPVPVEYEVVNLDAIAERFEAGADVTPELLREHGLVARRAKSRCSPAATSRRS